MSPHTEHSRLWRIVNAIEMNAIAILLGAMTVLTFYNVVLRYVYETSLIWGAELTLILFSWLVLIGMSHAMKINAHLGVDAILNMLDSGPRRILALLAAAACLLYGFLLLKGAWDFWAPFAGMERTSGRWFPTGFEATRDQAWYETDQVPMPAILNWLEGAINQGEPYEKLPRAVPYLVLPLGVALLLWRIVQASIAVYGGQRESLIVSHEAEDAIDDVRHLNQGD